MDGPVFQKSLIITVLIVLAILVTFYHSTCFNSGQNNISVHDVLKSQQSGQRQFKNQPRALQLPSQEKICLYKSATHFYLKELDLCRPFLTCEEISKNIKTEEKIIGNGGIKEVRIGYYYYNDIDWVGESDPLSNNFIKVAYVQSKSRTNRGKEFFDQGLENLKNFQGLGKKNVIKLYGFCKNEHDANEKTNEKANEKPHVMITEFCGHGDLGHFLNSETYTKFNIIGRIKLAISLLNTFKFLHNSPTGTRISCDMKARAFNALTQFLVNDDYEVVLNDIDENPVVSKGSYQNNTSLCHPGLFDNYINKHTNNGQKNLTIPEYKQLFIAPEQIDRKPTNEKMDIWKIPDMILFLLTRRIELLEMTDQKKMIKILETYEVKNILKNCKNIDSLARPSAVQIVDVFERVLGRIEFEGEKFFEHEKGLIDLDVNINFNAWKAGYFNDILKE